jgi:DNA-binding LytR/AlgR family response regulator
VRVLIVDDESAARRRLAIMLDELDVEVVGEAENGVAALDLVRDRRPDVILLDISMPEVDGFDVARHLDDPKPLIVFQTAYDEFAIQAFDHQAVDYLVKPVTLDKLQRSLDRAAAHLESRDAPALTADLLERLREAVTAGRPVRVPRLLIRHQNGHRLVRYQDVILFHASEGAVYARIGGENHLTDYTLAELEERTGEAFVRPNRADLVNANHILSIASNGDGSATLTMSDGQTVHIPRRRAAALRRALDA